MRYHCLPQLPTGAESIHALGVAELLDAAFCSMLVAWKTAGCAGCAGCAHDISGSAYDPRRAKPRPGIWLATSGDWDCTLPGWLCRGVSPGAILGYFRCRAVLKDKLPSLHRISFQKTSGEKRDATIDNNF